MKKRVLLVEDQNAFLVRELLALYGDFEIETVTTGLAAIDKLDEQLPDLVLLDLRLPIVSGLEVLEAIKRIEPCLPVVVVSAYGDRQTRQECRKRGADDFFLKPFDPHRLAKRMQILLATYGHKLQVSEPSHFEYNFERIRDLLRDGFSYTELHLLCFDVAEFRPVYESLADNTTKNIVVQNLLEYVMRHFLVQKLLSEAERRNPASYAAHQPYTKKS